MTLANHRRHEAVILGQLHEVPVAIEIRAAVTDVRDADGGSITRTVHVVPIPAMSACSGPRSGSQVRPLDRVDDVVGGR